MDADALIAHLEARYGVALAGAETLDVGVFRIDRSGDAVPWVVRVFPSARNVADVAGDAEILNRLERRGFPAERCARVEPVSEFEGRGVLVTEFIASGPRMRPGRAAAILGALLGRLHAHPGSGLRAGGAWHHLSLVGGPSDEVAAAQSLVEEALPGVGIRQLPLFDRLRDAVDAVDDCHDLPHAFVHPDFVPANAIQTPDARLVIVDWAGSGRGPRLWSLGFLLWAGGARHMKLVNVIASRYRRNVALEPEELERLAGAISARPVMLETWAFCRGRRELPVAVARIADAIALSEKIAAVARESLTEPG